MEKWINWFEKILYNPIALLGLGFTLLLLDKIRAYEKLKNWFKPSEVQHRRDGEIQAHIHKREDDRRKNDIIFEEIKKIINGIERTVGGLKNDFDVLKVAVERQDRHIVLLREEVKTDRQVVTAHMEKEQAEEGRFIRLESGMVHMEEKENREHAHLFKQNETLFTKFDDLTKSMDAKFETLHEAIRGMNR